MKKVFIDQLSFNVVPFKRPEKWTADTFIDNARHYEEAKNYEKANHFFVGAYHHGVATLDDIERTAKAWLETATDEEGKREARAVLAELKRLRGGKQGGAREGAGRKAADGAEGPFIAANVSITLEQRVKLSALGGSAFVRKMIEKEYAKWQKQQS